jgi:hypothetical protein
MERFETPFHLTINANGDVTVNDPTFEQICVG